jgi:hypothetical protein
MSHAPPLQRIAVGVVVERRKATSPWADFIWQPVSVLSGIPAAAPWTALGGEGEAVRYYAGAADVALHRSETENYLRNLQSGAPSVWVMLEATGGDPPYRLAAVTADPAEGEGLTEPGQGIIEAVPMPEPLREALEAFVAEHHVDQPFHKRKRDRADPEALARRGPLAGKPR